MSGKKNGSIIPEPFIEQIDKTAVSSEFLYLGHYIFNPPNNTDSNFDQERNLYNKASHVALSRLLKLVIELPDLPASLKELFISYSQTDIYTLPED